MQTGMLTGEHGVGISAAGGAVLSAGEGPWNRARRTELKAALAAGTLHELTFEAVVFVAGPNRNFVRFLPDDLLEFAASFAGVPFLRNHRSDDVGARDGTVLASWMAEGAMHQRILLSTQRGMRDFLDQVIDRFSIGWYYGGIACSICGGEWARCGHMPGRSYGDTDSARVCELIFLEPAGKETSAVNAPAVAGTRILAGEQVIRMAKHVQQEKEQGMQNTLYLPNGQTHVVAQPSSDAGKAGESPAAGRHTTGGDDAGQQLRAELAQMHADLRAVRTEQLLAQSGLGTAALAAVRLAAQHQPPEVVEELVEAQRRVEAAIVQREVVRGIRPVVEGDMLTTQDHFQAALNWMFGSERDPIPAPSLRRIGDLYQMITGDFNWYGTFNPEFSQLAAASTSTLAGMVVDALNRVVEQHFNNMMVYRWFEPIVSVAPHSGTTHDVNLIMVDGMANLPSVSEGAAYTEALVGDSKESMAFVKRGHYVGITLEAIRKSDIQRIQAIPREMVKSSVRTRSAAIAGIFTQASGTGPTLAQDSTVLFHSNHGNLDTGAFDAAEWAEARTRIWKQVIPGTGKALGLWPTFGLFPIDLYDTALTLFGYGAGDVGKPNSAGTAQEVNPYGNSRPGDPRPIPIAVPDWTDTNDWAYIVDPRLHPVIHMAYANAPQGGSHPMPEIFEATSETQGLMFTNDTLPVKVRDWWAYGVATYVGVGKNNVSGG